MYTSSENKRYVGKTIRSFQERNRDHKNCAIRFASGLDDKPDCPEFYNAVKQLGWDAFSGEILIECENDDLNYYETEMIAKYDTVWPNGYNCTAGGNGEHRPVSVETRERQSNSRKEFCKTAGDKLKRTERCIGLPMYMAYYKQEDVEGYKIYKHPQCETKKFSVPKYGSLEIAKLECSKFLDGLNNGTIQHIPKSLPRGISERGNGYRVRLKHNGKNIDSTFMNKSNVENLEDAMSFYDSIRRTTFRD